MSHVRTQIREAAAAALETVARVHPSRVYPVGADELPIVHVEIGEETVEGMAMGVFRRNAELIVSIRAAGQDAEDQLDDPLLKVEQALTRTTLGNLVRPIVPIRVETSFEQGSHQIGTYRVAFRAHYQTSFEDPSAAI